MTPRGFAHDRNWMIIDENGKFVTQRSYPLMSQISVSLTDEGLLITADGISPLRISYEANEAMTSAEIWKDTVLAQEVSIEAHQWFSQFLGADLRLVLMPEKTVRTVSPEHDRGQDQVGFADGYPFLVLSQASLDDLQSRSGMKIDALRFRPNLVIEDTNPYEEDEYTSFSIDGIRFHTVKPCARCVIPTIDPQTGSKQPELNRVMADYRTLNGAIMFGQNLVHDGAGSIRVGSDLVF